MGTPHKHAAVIKAWADGATIECRDPNLENCRWVIVTPGWDPHLEYRVKKEPRIIKLYLYSENDGKSFFSSVSVAPQNGHYPGFPKAKHVATYTYEVPENDA